MVDGRLLGYRTIHASLMRLGDPAPLFLELKTTSERPLKGKPALDGRLRTVCKYYIDRYDELTAPMWHPSKRGPEWSI